MRNASAMLTMIGAQLRAGLGIAVLLSSLGSCIESVRAADFPVKMIPRYAVWTGEAEVSATLARGFEREWTYFSAAFDQDQKDRYAVGASWLPNGVTFGISTAVLEGSGCLSTCPSQYTSSTFGRVGFTVDNTLFYAFAGVETRRDLFGLANVERSFLSGGAGLSAPFGENGQFYVEFEQKTQRFDCGSLCGANLLSKSDDYSFRFGVRQDFASLSDSVKKILGQLGRKGNQEVPVQPITPVQPISPSRSNTPFPGDH